MTIARRAAVDHPIQQRDEAIDARRAELAGKLARVCERRRIQRHPTGVDALSSVVRVAIALSDNASAR